MGVIKNHELIEDLRAHCETLTEEEYREIAGLFPKYIFYQKGRGCTELWTSCCGRHAAFQTEGRMVEPVPISLVHSYQTGCPWCGSTVHVLCWSRFRSGATLEKNARVMVLRAEGEYLYAAAFACGVEYRDMALHRPLWLRAVQMYRFALGEALEVDTQRADMENGPWMYREQKALRTERKYVQEPFLKGSVWWYQHEGYNVIGSAALASSPLRYCGYFTHWHTPEESGKPVKDLISYLTAYAIYPRQVEMLARTGVREPLETLMRSHGKSAPLIDFYAPDPRKAFGLDRAELRDFLASSRNIHLLPVYKRLRDHGLRTPFADLERLYSGIGETLLNRTAARMSAHKLRLKKLEQYLEREKARQKNPFADSVWYVWWLDYLDAAEGLGMDLANEIILLPRGLIEKHDEVTGTLAVIQEVESRKAMREKELPRMREVNQKYLYWDSRYLIRAPVGASEIIAEGKRLRHCVGGYAQRHIEGKVTILFLRDKRRPGKPLATIEMHGMEIVQIHGYKNDTAACEENPDRISLRELYRDFLDGWLAWLVAGSERDKAGRPVGVKRIRVVIG